MTVLATLHFINNLKKLLVCRPALAQKGDAHVSAGRLHTQELRGLGVSLELLKCP